MPKFTADQIKAHMDGLTPEQRADLLTRAALRLPKTVPGSEPLGPRDPSAAPAGGARTGPSGARGSRS